MSFPAEEFGLSTIYLVLRALIVIVYQLDKFHAPSSEAFVIVIFYTGYVTICILMLIKLGKT